MLKLGRAQGVAIAAALYRNIPIFEYSPKKIKQSVQAGGNISYYFCIDDVCFSISQAWFLSSWYPAFT